MTGVQHATVPPDDQAAEHTGDTFKTGTGAENTYVLYANWIFNIVAFYFTL
jgi:hypothetical protein